MAESPARLCLVISSLSGGGAERVMSILASEWARRGREVTLFTLDDGNGPNPYAIDPAVRYEPLNVASRESNAAYDPRNLLRLLRLRRAVRRSRPDAVVSFTDKTNIFVILSLIGTGLRVIVSERVHPAYNPIGAVWKLLRRFAYALARCIVVQTRDAEDFFPARLRRKTVVIPNPVSPAPEFARAGGARERRVVAMGRLDHQKGFDVLIEAFRSPALQHASQWTMTIYGEGPARAELEAAAAGDDRIHLPGWTPDVYEILSGSAIFVSRLASKVFRTYCAKQWHAVLRSSRRPVPGERRKSSGRKRTDYWYAWMTRKRSQRH